MDYIHTLIIPIAKQITTKTYIILYTPMTLTRRTPKSYPAVVDSTNNDRKLSSSIRGVESSSLDSGVPLGNDDEQQQQ